MALSTQQAKQLRLTDVLARLGCEPVRHKGQDAWYRSPFRQETEPSFKINIEKNLWYDFGEGKGGNILDFAMKYYRCGLSGALYELAHLRLAGQVEAAPLPSAAPDPITVTEVGPLVHMALLLYLDRRGIDQEIARRYLREMHYTRDGKRYFSLAFQSDSGGWEMRNPYFQGVHGPKDMTLLHAERAANGVLVFEGFMDFLSFLTWFAVPEPAAAVIVMNSAAMQDRVIAAIKQLGATVVHGYLDRDATGRKVQAALQAELPDVVVSDESGLYARHKDFNEFLQASRR